MSEKALEGLRIEDELDLAEPGAVALATAHLDATFPPRGRQRDAVLVVEIVDTRLRAPQRYVGLGGNGLTGAVFS